jgi:ssRNA-specific RNase YbeY (16S rRNA maturation enzyme)
VGYKHDNDKEEQEMLKKEDFVLNYLLEWEKKQNSKEKDNNNAHKDSLPAK